MTTDEVKAWLKSYRWLQAEIDNITDEITEWEARAARLTQSLSGMPSAPSGGDAIPNAVEKIVELKSELKEKMESLVGRRMEIEKTINSLSDKHRQLLYNRYIKAMTWEQVAVNMNLEYRWVLRIHGRALQEISKLTIESHL